MRRNSRKKNSTKVFIAATLVAAIAFGASNYLSNQSNDVVVAKINNQKIYKSEIEKKLRSVFEGQNLGAQDQEMKVPEVETLPNEVLEILVKEIYLEKELTKEAAKSKVSSEKEVKDRILEAKNRILRQAYVDSLLKEEISDQRISDKYSELSNELNGKKEYLISHIVTKTKEEAEKISQDLKNKKSLKFADEAKKSSIDRESAEKGGDLGYILENNMIKEIADVVVNLKAEDISDPIQTKFGWHVIKVSDVREAKALEFEAVKENIRDQLTQDVLNDINAKITKGAKVEILIKVKEPKAEEKSKDAAASSEKPAAVEAEKTPAEAEKTPAKTTETKAAESTEKSEKPAEKSAE